MTRFGLAFGILVAAAGCGRMAGMTECYAPFKSSSDSAGLAAYEPAPDEIDAAPDCTRIPEAALGFFRMGGGRGYFWIGYTAADIGQEDLSKLGRGDGFTFGGGFKLSEAGHTHIEIAFEKSLKHEMGPHPDPLPADPTNQLVTDSKAFHERSLLGLRTQSAPRARMQNQPRPYISYGIGYNLVKVRYDPGTGYEGYFMNGVGYYVGLGCEFPLEGRGAFSFDTKFHTWEDAHGNEGTYGSIAFALLWVNRF